MSQSFNADRKPGAAGPASNAEKARALLAILEPGKGTPNDIPPERLRDWANELIRTVEGEKAAAVPAAPPAPAPAPAKPPLRRGLFSKAPPTLTKTPPLTKTAPQTQPAPVRAAVPARPAAPARAATPAVPASFAAAPSSRLTLTAPLPHETESRHTDSASISPPVFGSADVSRIVDATLDRATLGREHPAIVAMTLLGKPTIEQAATLRSLPGGQVRAVHRALRQLEAARSPARQGAVSE